MTFHAMKRLILFIMLVQVSVYEVEASENVCSMFYQGLKGVPHDSLVIKERIIQSQFYKFKGCEVIFTSNERLMHDSKLPSFEAEKGSKLYDTGWRIDEQHRADGPGTGSYRIVKDKIECNIDWDHHAWLAEPAILEQSEFINMTVQCTDDSLSN